MGFTWRFVRALKMSVAHTANATYTAVSSAGWMGRRQLDVSALVLLFGTARTRSTNMTCVSKRKERTHSCHLRSSSLSDAARATGEKSRHQYPSTMSTERRHRLAGVAAGWRSICHWVGTSSCQMAQHGTVGDECHQVAQCSARWQICRRPAVVRGGRCRRRLHGGDVCKLTCSCADCMPCYAWCMHGTPPLPTGLPARLLVLSVRVLLEAQKTTACM